MFFILGGYIYYLYKYPEPQDIQYLLKYYPKDLILKTGGFLEPSNRRIQYFLNFSPSKKRNTIRIGAFGDSFTFGNEVDKTATYPYQLQQLFNRKFPNKKIEILNFGIPGGGLQGQFFLWDKYFSSYQIDYILLGPRGFYADRDLTFGKNYSSEIFVYPKNRFILSESETLKQIHIKGNTLKERYKNYYKLFPSRIALRYDKEPFQIWRIFSPHLKYIQNPFYYKKISQEEESVKINTLLLEKIRDKYNKKILFFTDSLDLFSDYSLIGTEYNLNLIEHKENLFYKMFDHKSSLGNKLIANIYFNALIGKKNFFLNIISCYFKGIDYITKSFDQDLYQVKSIQIITDSIPVFKLVQNSSDHDHYHTKRSYSKNRRKGIKSFLGFSNKSDFLKFPYFPLTARLQNGMKVYIQSKNHSRIKLGTIKNLDAFERFFVFYADFIERKIDLNYSYYESYFLLKKMSDPLKKKIETLKGPMELFIADYKLGTLWPHDLYGKQSLRFVPIDGYKKSFLMMGVSHYINEKDFPNKFPLYIQYNMHNGKNFRSLIPNWECRKEKNKIILQLPNFESLRLK